MLRRVAMHDGATRRAALHRGAGPLAAQLNAPNAFGETPLLSAVRAPVRVCVSVRLCVCARACACVRVCECERARKHRHAHARARARAHTHTHTHTDSHKGNVVLALRRRQARCDRAQRATQHSKQHATRYATALPCNASCSKACSSTYSAPRRLLHMRADPNAAGNVRTARPRGCARAPTRCALLTCACVRATHAHTPIGANARRLQRATHKRATRARAARARARRGPRVLLSRAARAASDEPHAAPPVAQRTARARAGQRRDRALRRHQRACRGAATRWLCR
jgi:hypothetical protein